LGTKYKQYQFAKIGTIIANTNERTLPSDCRRWGENPLGLLTATWGDW